MSKPLDRAPRTLPFAVLSEVSKLPPSNETAVELFRLSTGIDVAKVTRRPLHISVAASQKAARSRKRMLEAVK